tara:strand:+ start:16505 stop:17152 length:648 start_codon:yes stop_codon:yes gene_type:complete
MDKHRVGIVIPAFNESATISGIVESVSKYGIPIVVDDGSEDNTAELSSKSGAVVTSHKKNLGYDEALNSGFKKASEMEVEFIITIDADGQHDPSLLQKFIDTIDSGSDVVVGIRSRRQRLAEHLFAMYTKFRFGINDPLCGMKAYRTSVYKSQGHFDSFGSVGTELSIYAARKGYKITQIEFEVKDRNGKSRFGQVLSGNYKIIRAMMYFISGLK